MNKEIPLSSPVEGPPSNEGSFPKIQEALSRMSSLTEMLSKSKYPSKYVHLSSPTLLLSSRMNLLSTLLLTSLLLCFHTRLGNNEFIFYRAFWILVMLSFLSFSSHRTFKSLHQPIRLFSVIKLASSSVLYSLFYQKSQSYEFHIRSHEYDAITSVLLITAGMLYFQDNISQLKPYIVLLLVSNFVFALAIQVYYMIFDPAIYIYQIPLIIFISIVYRFQVLRLNIDKEAIEGNVAIYCEEISQGLRELYDNLKQEESQKVPNQSAGLSIADEILFKVKYLKFKLMQSENERRFLNAKNSVFGPKKGLLKGFSSVALRHPRNPDDKSINQRRSSFSSQDNNSNNGEGNNDEQNTDKWGLSAKDCDDLIKIVFEKQSSFYYPQALNENNQINNETAAFVKQHFTEVGDSLLTSESKVKHKSSYSVDPRLFAHSPWSEYLETNICLWNFDMPKFKDLTHNNHLPEFGRAIVQRFNILKTLNTTPLVVNSFLNDVSAGYLPNPYHNSIHGADVANSIGYFLSKKEFGGNFSELEISCLLIAALVHDVGHPGFNNAFLTATKSTEAMLYNDQSVLENLHSAYFFRIVQKQSSNILANLDDEDYKFFRKLIIGLILDTDLTKHFMILTKFKGIIDQETFGEEDRALSLSIALKCADVGHGAKELSLHKRWSRRIIEEFYLQGDKEREHGIPVSPLCQRSGNVSNSQQGFITFIVLPLYEAFDKKFFTEEMRKEVTNQVKKNLEYWKEEIPKEEKKESKFMEETQKVLEDVTAGFSTSR